MLLLLASATLQAQDAPPPGVAGPNGAQGIDAAADAGKPAGNSSDGHAEWMQAYMSGNPASDALWLGEGEAPFIAFSNKAVEAFQISLLIVAESPAQLTQKGWHSYLYKKMPLHGWSTLATLLPQGDSSGDQGVRRLQLASQWQLDQGARSFALVSDAATAPTTVNACIANADSCSGVVFWRLPRFVLAKLPLDKLKESRASVLDMLDGQPDADTRLHRSQLFRAAGFDRDYRSVVLPQGDSISTYALAIKRLRHWLDTTFERN